MLPLQKHIARLETTSRLSDYAVGIFDAIPTRKGIKKAIKKGAIYVNDEVGKTGTWVQKGDEVVLYDLDESPHKVYEFDLPIVYEDDAIALINKPGGIAISGNFYKTVQNALPYNLTKSTATDALSIPRPVHRIDAATCGLLLIAKTKSAHLHLSKQFEQKTIQKQYQAIVIGKLPKQGRIETPIDNKPSTTIYEQVEVIPSLKNTFLTLVNLYPVTGRTHQLRKHLTGLNHPILGDKLYGKEGLILWKKGLFLCAISLSFQHPTTSKAMHIRIEPPNKFRAILEREAKRHKKYTG